MCSVVFVVRELRLIYFSFGVSGDYGVDHSSDCPDGIMIFYKNN